MDSKGLARENFDVLDSSRCAVNFSSLIRILRSTEREQIYTYGSFYIGQRAYPLQAILQ